MILIERQTCAVKTLYKFLLQGRIRGTYGINAKPIEAEPPAESPPGPGVTRASLRPKPVAKALPDDEEADGIKTAGSSRQGRAAAKTLLDDEEAEGIKAAAGSRQGRTVANGPEAGVVQDSPGSPKAQAEGMP